MLKKKVICIAYLFISIKYDSFLQHDGISKHFFFNQTEINPMRVYRNDPNIFTWLANNNFCTWDSIESVQNYNNI